MDFFEHQDRARFNTKWLIFYFALAVIGVIVGVYFAGVVTWAFFEDSERLVFHWWNPTLLGYSTLGTILVVAIGTLYKIGLLQQGGSIVAASLGGKPVNLNTQDPDERQLLNVVEEMAIASGTPVPEVYILNHEFGINAFAAGHTPSDAVIGITRGTLKHLKRDELQGVIAHEFSHILNGDMRLNIRLMGILNGLLCIALLGYFLFRISLGNVHTTSSRKGNGGMPLILLGMLLATVGYIGVFFAKLIKSAVSRQREFLADASAVQFTRNPAGIVNALKKIGGAKFGSRIFSPSAEEASHLYFSNGLSNQLFMWMSTHPPLAKRIRAIDPNFDGRFIRIKTEPKSPPPPQTQSSQPSTAPLQGIGLAVAGAAAVQNAPKAIVQSTGTLNQKHIYYAQALRASIPKPLLDASHETFGARALIYGLLLVKEDEPHKKQRKQLEKFADPGVVREMKQFCPLLEQLPEASRLPLVDLAIPALRQLSPAQFETFSVNVRNLIEADQTIDLFEYTLQKILFRHLNSHFGKTIQPQIKHRSIYALTKEISLILSVLASLQADEPSRKKAFQLGVQQINTSDRSGFVQVPQFNLSQVDEALDKLAVSAPFIQKNALYAGATVITSDGSVRVEELELLRAMADALGCPIPPFVFDN